MYEETSTKSQQAQASSLPDAGNASPCVARWWGRPVEKASRSSKAICMLTAAFALTTALGALPPKAFAEGFDYVSTSQGEEQQGRSVDEADGSDAAAREGTSDRGSAWVSTTVPGPSEPRMQPVTDSSASLSLAAAYVSSEEQDDPADGSEDDEDVTGDDAVRELGDDVLTSTDAGAVVQVGAGEHVSAARLTLISIAPEESSALSVANGGTAEVEAASTFSARGERSVAVSCANKGSTVRLSNTSVYASGERCAALAAADGADVSMEQGSLEATSGTVVRAEGSGSSVSIADAQILSTGALAELCGNVVLELDGVSSTSSHTAAIYVAAGVPTVRLANGSVVRGAVVVADGADIDIQTDATSRIDGRIVHLSSASVA